MQKLSVKFSSFAGGYVSPMRWLRYEANGAVSDVCGKYRTTTNVASAVEARICHAVVNVTDQIVLTVRPGIRYLMRAVKTESPPATSEVSS